MKTSLKYKKRYKTPPKTISVCFSIIICVFSLILFGFFYQKASDYLQSVTSKPVSLEKPLSELKKNIGQWQGRDVPISLEVLKVAQNDDYVNRLYSIPSKRLFVNLYIAFSSTPRTMLGHRPRVCYRGAGWVHDSTEEFIVETENDKEIPALIHKFHKDIDDVYVLNFYVLNGKATNSEKGFSGVNLRTPNIDGELAKYVAQIQISGRYRADIELAAKMLLDEVMTFFPPIGNN